jgi:hypothetical protein
MSLFNFNEVEAAEGKLNTSNYLKPGAYMMKPTDCTYGTSSQKGTPYIEVQFTATSTNPEYHDGIAKTKFWISAKALPRLQYFHLHAYGKGIDKQFDNEQEIYDYFKSVIKGVETKPKAMWVGGSISQDGQNLYSDIVYSGFYINTEENEFVEGPVEEGSKQWNALITSDIKKLTPRASGSSAGDDSDLFS